MNPVDRNNVKILGNSRAKRTLLLSHGFGADQTSWSRLIPYFEADYRIVAFDHVGFGQSDPAAFVQGRYLNLDAFAQDILGICDQLGLWDIHAIGHSKGAMACVLAAIAQPKRFSRLALIGASPRYLDDGEYHGGLTQADLDGIYRGVIERYGDFVRHFANDFVGDRDPDFKQSFIETLERVPPDQALTVLSTVLQSDYREDVGKLGIPTLLIQPSSDQAVPMQVAEFLHARISGSRLVVIENNGHFPHVTATKEVASAIRGWFRPDRGLKGFGPAFKSSGPRVGAAVADFVRRLDLSRSRSRQTSRQRSAVAQAIKAQSQQRP